MRVDTIPLRTIGILGLGAKATVDFETRLHQVSANRLVPRTPVLYPPTITWHHRRAPVVVKEDFSVVMPLQVDPQLLQAARWLGRHADFLVMTANAPHKFRPEIEHASGKPMLSMLEVTIAEVQRRGWKRVGALAFLDAQATVYTQPLQSLGLQCEIIDQALQDKLSAAIYRTMASNETDDDRAVARQAIEMLRGSGVDGVIPGCTEIPLLLGEAFMQSPDLVNPAQLLAESAVERAMGR